jgi:crotonobetainyl-CoA:carnitine CoA-transferase CaiB-like acyl-CoA transferase
MTPLDICLLQWTTYNTRMQKVFDSIDDKRYFEPIAEGSNSPSWILGHLVETEDNLLVLFGIRERLYPDLKDIYHHKRESNQTGHLSKDELVKRWKAVSAELDKAFKSWSESNWMGRHNAVSEEDFRKEPHRNKLNVMLSRVGHKASHLGQVAMGK